MPTPPDSSPTVQAQTPFPAVTELPGDAADSEAARHPARRCATAPPLPFVQVLEEEFLALGLITEQERAPFARRREALKASRGQLRARIGQTREQSSDPTLVARQAIPESETLDQEEERITEDLLELAAQRTPAALCLSGGGIRSATFNLGVLQSLARHGLLTRFHYLSTVSGGGYIGSWLTAWIHNEGGRPEDVARRLASSAQSPLDPEPSAVRHLREYSNYLSPKLGLFSADTWSLAAAYVRNLLLNWAVLLPIFAGVLILPRLAARVVHELGTFDGPLTFWLACGALVLSGVLEAAAVAYMDRHGPSIRGKFKFSEPNNQKRFLLYCLLPHVSAAILFCSAWPRFRPMMDTPDIPLLRNRAIWAGFLLAFTFAWIGAAVVSNESLRDRRYDASGRRSHRWSYFWSLLVSGTVASLALFLILTRDWMDPLRHARTYVALALPAYLLTFMLGGVLFRAFTVRASDDDDREWAGRAEGWFLLVALSWPVVSTLVLFGPSWLLALGRRARAGALSLGAIAGVASAWLGKSSGTPATSERAARATVGQIVRQYALALAAPLFILFFMVVVSLATTWLCSHAPDIPANLTFPGWMTVVIEPYAQWLIPPITVPVPLEDWHREVVLQSGFFTSLGLMVLLVGGGLAMSHWVSVNKFSLHAVYRNRLIRAYLGASRRNRNASPSYNPFTGFDPQDNMPLHVINLDQNQIGPLTDFDAVADRLRGLEKSQTKLDQYLKGHLSGSLALLRHKGFPIEFGTALRDELNQLIARAELPNDPPMHELLLPHERATLKETLADERSRRRLHAALVRRAMPEIVEMPCSGAAAGERPPVRLFHVLNAALNLVAGDRLAWQQRKAESFTATPLHCGSYELGYRRSKHYAGGIETGRGGRPAALTPHNAVSLGGALTVSGAAASPNMGYHSSPPIAFLLTLFNVRLGVWVGNPGWPGGGRRPTFGLANPRLSVKPLLQEAFALTDDQRAYVYLSDGGHFDNLGVYEMLRRRCRLIVACDAGADPECDFSDLASVLRKASIDLGLRITFRGNGKLPIYKRAAEGKEAPPDAAYHAVATIDYAPDGKPDGNDDTEGILIYIKAALYDTGEPAHVVNYAKTCLEFPHQSTADQFFSESQFESYRALGEYIGNKAAADILAGFEQRLKAGN
jgi:hypothetical protein